MKIAYISIYDSNNVHSWSGLGYNIANSLRNSGNEIEMICPLTVKNKYYYFALKAINKFIFKKKFLIDRVPAVVKDFACQYQKRLNEIKPDLILSPGTLAIAELETDIPIITWADATLSGLVDYYEEYTNINKKNIREAEAIEKKALDKCAFAVYTSEWAAESAIRDYNIPKEKVKVINFGANVNHKYSLEEISRFAGEKPKNEINLLFMGVDWIRKGGEIALETARILNKKGYKTSLEIVGCAPPREMPDFVHNHGFVSKSNKVGQDKFDSLFKNAHFLIVPTRAECYGLVFAEANSYGVPAIATNTGGIPSIIKNDVNGKMFDLTAKAEEYADYIITKFSEPEKYRDFSISSFKEYEQRLTWENAAGEFKEMISELGIQTK